MPEPAVGALEVVDRALAQYPGAPVYVLTQGKGMEDLPAYLPASRDSILETLSPR